MNILFATAHLPSLKGAQAGAKTSYGICKVLAETDAVHLLAFATDFEMARFDEAEQAIFRSWALFSVYRSSRLKGILGAPQLPLAVAARWHSEYLRRFLAVIEEQHIDVVIFDHTAMMQYQRWTPDSVVTVASLHDVLSQSWDRRWEASRGFRRHCVDLERSRMRHWEARALASIDIVSPHNVKDAQLISRLASTKHQVLPIQPWVDSAVFQAAGKRDGILPESLLYWGAMDRAENVDAVLWAVSEIMPRIWKERPSAKFYIAGSKSELLKSRLPEDDRIVVMGFIDDVHAMMARMQIALLPLRLGAGIKVKTLECMAAALPVVTTEVGSEGIEAQQGAEYLLGETAEALAQQTLTLLDETDRAYAMGVAARSFLFAWYDFEGRVQQMRTRMQELATQRIKHVML